MISASKHWVIILDKPSVDDARSVMQIDDAYVIPEWERYVIEYLKNGQPPNEKKEARKIRMQSARYTFVGNILYRRGYSLPLLKCLSATEIEYVLKEIHEGVCGSHSGGRMLAHKAVRAGYYWPTMNQESMEMVRRCDKCQKFTKLQTKPPAKLSSVSSPWPFSQWGVNIVGPMPIGKGNCRFLVVAVDYFTKWAEAGPLMTITTGAIKNFLWKAIICRFGIPYALITDNGTQFDCKPFQEWCDELKIRHFFSSVYHSQSNGQVEATNKTLVKILKKKLPKRKGGWVEYLPEVMWSYRTTISSATSETPYLLALRVEAVIPVEIGSPSFRIQHYNPGFNSTGLKLHLDLLEEKREDARVRTSAYQEKVARYYNKRVKPRSFNTGDWVLRRITTAAKDPTEGKLGPVWE